MRQNKKWNLKKNIMALLKEVGIRNIIFHQIFIVAEVLVLTL